MSCLPGRSSAIRRLDAVHAVGSHVVYFTEFGSCNGDLEFSEVVNVCEGGRKMASLQRIGGSENSQVQILLLEIICVVSKSSKTLARRNEGVTEDNNSRE